MMETKEKEWSFAETVTLIQEYEKHPCLYNSSLLGYKDRDKKRDALLQIAALFGDVTPNDIVKKFTRLRTQYNRERAKLTPENSAEGSPKPKITWVHFEPLNFLKNFYHPNSSQRSKAPAPSGLENGVCVVEAAWSQANDGVDGADGGYQIDGAKEKIASPSTCSTAVRMRPVKNKMKRKRDVQMPQKLQNGNQSPLEKAAKLSPIISNNEMSPDDIFGLYVASELKAVEDESLKKLMKHRIHNVLFETQVHTVSPTPVNNTDFTLQGPRTLDYQSADNSGVSCCCSSKGYLKNVLPGHSQTTPRVFTPVQQTTTGQNLTGISSSPVSAESFSALNSPPSSLTAQSLYHG